MAGIERRLAVHQQVGIDTSIFIYHLEAHPDYKPLTRTILTHIQNGTCYGVLSVVTVMELTVRPWQINRGDIARQYEVVLANFPNLILVDVNRDIARHAAQLRARYNLQPADALLVATAQVNGATAWITNDKRLKRLDPEIEIIILDDFIP